MAKEAREAKEKNEGKLRKESPKKKKKPSSAKVPVSLLPAPGEQHSEVRACGDGGGGGGGEFVPPRSRGLLVWF